MFLHHGFNDDYAGMGCDLSQGRNQSIHTSSVLIYEEDKATLIVVASASTPPLFPLFMVVMGFYFGLYMILML